MLTLCLLVVFMTSCKTKEEKVIHKLQALAERIENKGDSFDEADWDKVMTDLEAIQQQAKECEFSSEQLKELAKAETEVNAAIVKHGFKKAVKDFNDTIEEGAGVVNGILDGVKESFGSDDE